MNDQSHRLVGGAFSPVEAALLDLLCSGEGREWSIDGARAEAFITALFHRSLAYGIEMMPATTAAWLASQFIDAAGEYGSRFATNSGDMPGDNPFMSTPATSYPFDTGVAVIGTNGGGLIWFADET